MVLVTETTERNPMNMDKIYLILARGRLRDACERADHVDVSTRFRINARKHEALWLIMWHVCWTLTGWWWHPI